MNTNAEEDTALRRAIIDGCLRMNREGINQGTSGNISIRYHDQLLITPSGIPYDSLTPDRITSMPLSGDDAGWTGPLKPSSERHFHRDILRARPETGPVVHLHSSYATALAMARKANLSCHSMVACIGGNNVRCGGYARYGTPELSRIAVKALEDRTACLLANHGTISIGSNLEQAPWPAVELETLAKQYYLTLPTGGPVMPTDERIDETLRGIESYGINDDNAKK